MESTLCWPGQLSEKDVLVGEQSSGFGDQVYMWLDSIFWIDNCLLFFLILQAGGILQILQSDSFWEWTVFYDLAR